MDNIMQDKYNLEQSNNKKMQDIKNGINLNLKLNLNTNNLTGLKIYGAVKDKNNRPIVSATIKIMSSDYHPLFHTKTNSIGEYLFNNLPNDKIFNIFALAKGYMLEQNNINSFLGIENLKLDFILKEDEDLKFGIISGTILSLSTKENKENVVVKLINLNNNNNEALEAITYSNKKGEFVFSKVEKGSYLVNISALGYNTVNVETNIINDGQLVKLNVSITQKANIKTGIISGYIKDCENDNFIENADVILYEVKKDNSLNPIAFTKTIKDGFYMFANVVEGTYKIKSNELKDVEVNFPSDLSSSPNFYSFSLSNNEVFNKIFYAKDVSLYGAARIENGFVENIGAFLGYLIFKINVPKDGAYNLIIKYVTTYNNKVCNILVNNISTETLYGFETTESLYLSSAKEKLISLNLTQGENVIKIYNE